MAKNKLLMVDLNDKKTKKLAEIITSDTSRKILDYLADKEDSEQNIAKELKIPISTVHYHLLRLVEANLVIIEEFHYSKKGREVNHYKLANKYIIIAPKKVSGIKRALNNILPVALIVLGISAALKIFNKFTAQTAQVLTEKAAAPVVQKAAYSTTSGAVETAKTKAAPMLADTTNNLVNETVPKILEKTIVITQQPDIALWFLVGGLSSIVMYLLFMFVKEKRKN